MIGKKKLTDEIKAKLDKINGNNLFIVEYIILFCNILTL